MAHLVYLGIISDIVLKIPSGILHKSFEKFHKEILQNYFEEFFLGIGTVFHKRRFSKNYGRYF